MSEQTPVGHCKLDNIDVYVGRGPGRRDMTDTEIGERGWLGNPYPKDEHGREDCLLKFTADFVARLETDPEFRAAVRELHGQTLGCWCHSLDADQPACHGDVIAEWADRLAD